MSEPYQITGHAIDQFRSRWRSKTRQTDRELHDELMGLLNSSKPFEKTILGDQIHISGLDPEIRMVVKDRVVCVTVLPKRNRAYLNLIDMNDAAVREEFERLAQEQKEREEVMQAEILTLEQQVADIDRQRKELGQKKHELHDRIQMLKNQAKYGVKL